MHNMKTFKPVNPKYLRGDEIMKCLESLMLLNQKRGGIIKVFHCIYVLDQQYKLYQKDSMSPTVSTEAIFIMSVIEAFENLDVAVTDIPGSILSANMEEVVHMKI